MWIRLSRSLSLASGVLTLLSVGVLLTWDWLPGLFPAGSHNFLGAFPLAMIAFAYMIYQSAHRLPPREWIKSILLAFAFWFWAANQFWPNLQQAVLFNDIAVGLFVLDVFLVMVGWPATSPKEAETDRLASQSSSWF